MIYITHSHSLDFSIESPAHCYLDLETTGLSKIHDTIVCIGIAFKKKILISLVTGLQKL